MPNTREKLINERLDLADVICYAMRDWDDYMDECRETETTPIDSFEGFIADGVLSAGYHKQKWIPVRERLPEICDTYLVVVKYKYDWEKEYNIDTDVATFYPYDNPDAYIDNRWNTYIDWDEGQQYIHITHWMPLPEPPKGE